jgi:glycosyltransferase involved in cell wall biosynthesis
MPLEANVLRFLIVIPAYNEEKYIKACIDSLLNQSLQPKTIVVVDDSSTDGTLGILKAYDKNPVVTVLASHTNSTHQPGAKVVNAFKRGLELVTIDDYDVVCKFDADLEFPFNYLETLNSAFLKNQCIGLCGGVCSVEKNGIWVPESLTNLDHVRGALKAYSSKAFKEIDGLKSQMGWDTADEFKLRFRKWEVSVLENLHVKHKKNTGSSYTKTYFSKQGQVFFSLRYDFFLLLMASLKLSIRTKHLKGFFQCVSSYFQSKKQNLTYLLDAEEGHFLRAYRYKAIWKKLKL